MRLKSLKLSGFKSFANPTTFTFKHGITAIVGPNGCGKSNVIDAIRWVLGESSAKQLRGGAMSDVIFAGTQDKSAKSLASVEMTFEHTQDEQSGIRHELNLYQELSVRRQVTLGGKSDYFINGTRCRRRDVVDVFLGTGLGPRSYSVIQQGMIGRIVDSSPLQLREFIEEAAGVSRYQARREETQKKLVKTRENLERLNDIKSELNQQHKKLRKQAESAKKYQQIERDLQQTKTLIAGYQLLQAQQTAEQHKRTLGILTDEIAGYQTLQAATKQKQDELNKRLSEEQWLKDEAREGLHQQQLARQQAAHELTTLQEQLAQLQGQLQGNADKLTQSRHQLTQSQDEAQKQSDVLATLLPQLEALNTQKEKINNDHTALQNEWAASQQHIQQLEQQRNSLQQTLALDKQALSQREQALQKGQQQDEQWQQQAQECALSIQGSTVFNSSDNAEGSITEQLERIESELARLLRQQSHLEEQVEDNEPKLAELQQQLRQQQAALVTLEKAQASLAAEYDTLHAIVHPAPSKSLSTEVSPSPVTQTTEHSSLRGLPMLHEHITLTKKGEQYAQSLDKWLAFWLESRVIDLDETSIDKTGLDETNSQETANKATWLSEVLALSPEKVDKRDRIDSVLVSHSTVTTLQDISSLLLPIADLIKQPQLNIWQHAYLYIGEKDCDISDLLASLPTEGMILMPSGWIVSHIGAIHLNKLMGKGQNDSAFLQTRLTQQKRLDDLDDLLNEDEDKIEGLQKQVKQNDATYEQLKISHDELLGQLSSLIHQQQTLTQQRTELNAEKQHQQIEDARQQKEQARLQQLRDQLDTEHVQIKGDIDQLQQTLAITQQRIGPVLSELQVAKQQHTDLEQARQNLRHKEQEDNALFNKTQLAVNQAQLAMTHHQEKAQLLQAEIDRLTVRQQRLTQDHDRLNEKQPALEQAQKLARSAAHESEVAVDERQGIITALQLEVKSQQQRLEQQQQQLDSNQSRLADSTAQLAVANERIAEAGERLKVLDNTVELNDFSLDTLTCLTLNTESNDSAQSGSAQTDSIHSGSTQSKDSQDVDRVDDLSYEQRLEALQSNEQQLINKQSRIGAVNLAAVQELEELTERLQPLEQHIDDITDSMTLLNDAINTIDAKTKTLFLETLNAVNESFTALFTKVFDGGQAKLTLLKDDELSRAEQWRAGLELMAQPKGKKNSRLAVLSGGEKTLTALSLVFAIFKQHPAPFCVLDEVDAPLDDANVARFTNLIGDLAGDVQFIFISHNKLAMQIADDLKGITMPQAGISTLVSVSLAEASQYIDIDA